MMPMRAAIAGTVIAGTIVIYKFLDYNIRWKAQEEKKKNRFGSRLRLRHAAKNEELKPVPPIKNAKDLLGFLWADLKDYGKEIFACLIPKKKDVDLRGNLAEVRQILENCHSIHQTQQVILEYSIMLGNARYYAEMMEMEAHEEENGLQMGPPQMIWL